MQKCGFVISSQNQDIYSRQQTPMAGIYLLSGKLTSCIAVCSEKYLNRSTTQSGSLKNETMWQIKPFLHLKFLSGFNNDGTMLQSETLITVR